eukprot:CAMPEP_0113854372 /NCGR_PEP_ID=MMETSP0372-20130328/7272_1 /TAXON_ID=340204 /ORGANISM="Lankesteria abbotti" /LENGTH=106 /DNA_ID=CAMNT_0000827511 /DNA_START=186 /DNA_END=506 /DNA_ORIENTATION=- /assembly_acc=CAM_ASM_000359
MRDQLNHLSADASSLLVAVAGAVTRGSFLEYRGHMIDDVDNWIDDVDNWIDDVDNLIDDVDNLIEYVDNLIDDVEVEVGAMAGNLSLTDGLHLVTAGACLHVRRHD